MSKTGCGFSSLPFAISETSPMKHLYAAMLGVSAMCVVTTPISAGLLGCLKSRHCNDCEPPAPSCAQPAVIAVPSCAQPVASCAYPVPSCAQPAIAAVPVMPDCGCHAPAAAYGVTAFGFGGAAQIGMAYGMHVTGAGGYTGYEGLPNMDGGGKHGRYPYHSYRRPWAHPGPMSTNVSIVW